MKRLKFWLSQELGGHDARIFVDQESIEIGDHWPDSLKVGIQSSKCMVGIWSPRYFQSKWCVSEWQSFLAREQLINLGVHTLVAPVRFHDGEHFPPQAANVQSVDFSSYITPYTGLLATHELNQILWDTHDHLFGISSSGRLYAFKITATGHKQAAGSPYSITNPMAITVLSK